MTTPSTDPAAANDHSSTPDRGSQPNDAQADRHAFTSYLHGMKQSASRPAVAFPRAVFAIALISNLIVTATGFAPWITFTRRSNEEDYLTGLQTDGMFAILTSAVAVIALIVSSRRGNGGGDFESLVALVASIATFVLVGVNFINVDSFPIDNIFNDTRAAGWGLIAAQIMSVVSVASNVRFWRIMSVY